MRVEARRVVGYQQEFLNGLGLDGFDSIAQETLGWIFPKTEEETLWLNQQKVKKEAPVPNLVVVSLRPRVRTVKRDCQAVAA